MRNILSNAGATRIVRDDVVKPFMDRVKTYSQFHFQVVARIYNHARITRAGVWDALGREPVREDSADADLFGLLFHWSLCDEIPGIVSCTVLADYYAARRQVMVVTGGPLNSI